MFQKLIKSANLDKDYPKRSQLIDMYMRVLNGELYDCLKYDFCDEYDSVGKYIPLHCRQPSVVYNLCKLVVDESVSLLFGKDHFPSVHAGKENANELKITEDLNDVLDEINIRRTMVEAATVGSTGSVAVFFRIIDDKYNLEVKGTQYLTAHYDPSNPCKLSSVVEQYKVKGKELKALGYVVDGLETDYWFKREWNDTQEIYYLPYERDENPRIDKERTIDHGLDFVPVVWIKNLPKASCKGYQEIDGSCSFAPAIKMAIEIDYLLSQSGRGLKYSADPLIVFRIEDELTLSNNAIEISGDITGAKKIVRSANNALVVGTKDDAKLLEINGKAAAAVVDQAKFLRELAIESIHGNRLNADKVTATQSGVAMQAMNQPLIWLADTLRIYYGEGLIKIIKMIIEASHKHKVLVKGEVVKPMDTNMEIKLKWPDWYPPTPNDKVLNANALKTLQDSGHLSRETAVKSLENVYHIPSVADELVKIKADQKEFFELTQPKTTQTVAV